MHWATSFYMMDPKKVCPDSESSAAHWPSYRKVSVISYPQSSSAVHYNWHLLMLFFFLTLVFLKFSINYFLFFLRLEGCKKKRDWFISAAKGAHNGWRALWKIPNGSPKPWCNTTLLDNNNKRLKWTFCKSMFNISTATD